MEQLIEIASQLEPEIGQEAAGVEAISNPVPDDQNAQVVDDAPDPSVAGQTENVEANPKKRKEYVQRSVVWDHFESIKDSKGVIMQAKCAYCARIYNCNAKKNGTSTLRSHLVKCTKHPHSIETSLCVFTDLEVDHMNPFEARAAVNVWILPEFVLQGVVCILFLLSRHWFLFLFFLPLTCYHLMN